MSLFFEITSGLTWELVQDELVVFIGKGMNIVLNFALLCLEMIGHVGIKSVELHVPKFVGSYVDWRKEFVAKDCTAMSFQEETICNAIRSNGTYEHWNGKIDRKEFEVMMMGAPLWTEKYAEAFMACEGAPSGLP